MSMKGESDQINVSDPVEMIPATPASDRSHFATENWRLRREGGEITDTILNCNKQLSCP